MQPFPSRCAKKMKEPIFDRCCPGYWASLNARDGTFPFRKSVGLFSIEAELSENLM